MATGIEFYKMKKFDGFKNCEETVDFTRLMNNLFDALNRKFPAEGIKPNGKDLEVFYFLYVLHDACVSLISGKY